jgi:hypothetical protein
MLQSLIMMTNTVPKQTKFSANLRYYQIDMETGYIY